MEKEVRTIKTSVQKKLKGEIVKKLEDYMSVSSNMLAEYIMTLLLHSNNQSQVSEKLKEFLGDNAEEFSYWLFKITYSYSIETK
jgi:hypothetical protein